MKRLFLLSLCAIAPVAISCSNSEIGGSSDENGENIQYENREVIKYEADTHCESHETLCNGVCTDIKTSISHCGQCGNICSTDEVCVDGECSSCTATVCGSECVDTSSNANHCGGCNLACGKNMACSDAQCDCQSGYSDCDGDSANGCEIYGYCFCTPGETREYYTGPEGTEGVGECKAGRYICKLDEKNRLNFEIEYADVTPTYVAECTERDYNCNGTPDGQEDNDGDGYTVCGGDCCDSTESCNALNPELVNPSMLEVAGNQLDDNCNGYIDEDLSTLENMTPVDFVYDNSTIDDTARAMAYAMGIRWSCEPNSSCAYGLVDAKLTRAESSALPDKKQVNVMSKFRDAAGIARIMPREGNSFVVMSTGDAIDVYSGVTTEHKWFEEKAQDDKTITDGTVQRYPKYSRIPQIYLDNHNNQLATHAACPAKEGITPAIFDSVQLHLEIKVPLNVQGIAFDFRFFSREYPRYLCSSFNDFFLALLSTTHEELENYPDHNIAFDKLGNPVSVNNGFFTTCAFLSCQADTDCPAFMACDTQNGHCSTKTCQEDESGTEVCAFSTDTCQDGATAIDAYYPKPYDKYPKTASSDSEEGRGGGTAWLTTQAPVKGGETIQLDFYIWDTQDGNYDSTVLIDNFRWLLDETKVNTGLAEDTIIN